MADSPDQRQLRKSVHIMRANRQTHTLSIENT